jgi:hypothetical protein
LRPAFKLKLQLFIFFGVFCNLFIDDIKTYIATKKFL